MIGSFKMKITKWTFLRKKDMATFQSLFRGKAIITGFPKKILNLWGKMKLPNPSIVYFDNILVEKALG